MASVVIADKKHGRWNARFDERARVVAGATRHALGGDTASIRQRRKAFTDARVHWQDRRAAVRPEVKADTVLPLQRRSVRCHAVPHRPYNVFTTATHIQTEADLSRDATEAVQNRIGRDNPKGKDSVVTVSLQATPESIDLRDKFAQCRNGIVAITARRTAR